MTLAGTGYVAGTEVQPADARDGILALVGLIPATGFALAAACMYFYRLSAAEHRRMIGDIARAREERACSSPSSS